MLVGTNASTAQFQFNNNNTLINKFELKWNYVTGPCLDNINSNIGVRNLIKQ